MKDLGLRGKLGRRKPSSQLEELGHEAISNRLSTANLLVAGVRGALYVCVHIAAYLA